MARFRMTGLHGSELRFTDDALEGEADVLSYGVREGTQEADED